MTRSLWLRSRRGMFAALTLSLAHSPTFAADTPPTPAALDALQLPNLGGGGRVGDGRLPGLPALGNAPGTGSTQGALAAPGVHPVQLNMIQALQSRAHIPQSTPVPPTQEIEILDPNVDANGRPAVIPVTGPDGQARIDIPPAVVVHKFYYTGDRSFQGPMIPGGPTIVVASHPGTGERIYLELSLPPGAPRIIYTHHAIEYNYGVQSIILNFGSHGSPKITYRQGVPTTARVRAATSTVTASTARLIRRTGLPEASGKVARGAVNVVETAADRTHDVGKAVVTPVIQIVKVIPGINFLASSADKRVTDERNTLVGDAESATNRIDATIPTIR